MDRAPNAGTRSLIAGVERANRTAPALKPQR